MADRPVPEVLINNMWQDVHHFTTVRHNGSVTISDDAVLAVALNPVNPHRSSEQAWIVTLYLGEYEEVGAFAEPIVTFEKPLRYQEVPRHWYANVADLAKHSHEGLAPVWPAISAGIALSCPLDVAGRKNGVLVFRFKVGRRLFEHTERDADALSDMAALVRSKR